MKRLRQRLHGVSAVLAIAVGCPTTRRPSPTGPPSTPDFSAISEREFQRLARGIVAGWAFAPVRGAIRVAEVLARSPGPPARDAGPYPWQADAARQRVRPR